jgi:hypothetical protein
VQTSDIKKAYAALRTFWVLAYQPEQRLFFGEEGVVTMIAVHLHVHSSRSGGHRCFCQLMHLSRREKIIGANPDKRQLGFDPLKSLFRA